MKHLATLLLTLFVSTGVEAQVYADVSTSKGDFTIELDYQNAPLAVTNFSLLSGKEDELWRGSNVESTPIGNYTHPQLLNMTVEYYDHPSVHVPPVYLIKQSQTLLGQLDVNTRRDLSGQNHYSLEWSLAENRWHLTFHYPHPWIDPTDNQIKHTTYYKNLPITKIDFNKRFYTGTQTNAINDGPGYRFQDEISRLNNPVNPWGTPFNSAYVVAMDSYAPNTNGSRFFITRLADPSLNGKFTPFGIIPPSPGRLVVDDIMNDPTHPDMTPVSNITLNSISIRKVGSAIVFMEAFHRLKLPSAPRQIDLCMTRENGIPTLAFPSPPYAQTAIAFSTDLINYSPPFTLSTPPGENSLTYSLESLLPIEPKAFFKAYQVTYPLQPATELALENAQLRFQIHGPTPAVLLLTFTSSGANGNYIYQSSSGSSSGTFTAGYTVDDPFKATLAFFTDNSLSNLDELVLHFGSDPETNSANVIRRFTGYDTDGPFPQVLMDGVWQKTN